MSDDYTENLVYRPPIKGEKLECEYGFDKNIRFFLKSDSIINNRCLDCEAKFYIDKLENDDCNMMTIKEAVLWILENTEWPTYEN